MSLGQPDCNRILTVVTATLSVGLLLSLGFFFWLTLTYPHVEKADGPSSHDGHMIVLSSGGMTVVESVAQAPGTGSLRERAFPTNALGILKMKTGSPSRAAGLVSYNREAAVDSEAKKNTPGLNKEAQIQIGKAIYWMACLACHQPEGQGIADRIPPLAKSDVLMASKEDNIRRIMLGCRGEIIVNGKTYNSNMPPLSHLADGDIAHVLTYVRNSWGNSGDAVTIQEVAGIRRQSPPPPPPIVVE